MAQRSRLVLLAIGFAALPRLAEADEPGPFGNTLTGDWGGWRTRLSNDGIDFNLGYTTENAANVQGGTKQGVRYTDQWTFGATFDLDKLLDLNNARFQVSITDRNGRNLSSDEHLGSLQQVQEVFGRGQTWRITQLWYEQAYFNNTLDWKIGRLTDGEDFASFSCDFMDLTFCGAPPGNLVGSYWFNWPVSQWATRLKANVPNFGYVQIGAYEVNPSYLSRRYAFDPGDPPGATGALIPFEVGWVPTFSEAHLQGTYKFGLWYNTSKTPDVVENTQGEPLAISGGRPRQREGAYGAYINFLQKLTNPSATQPDRGLSAFLNVTFADRRTATLDNQVAVGVKYAGPFDSRPQDVIALAFGRTHVNTRVKQVEELENEAGLGPVPLQGSEYVTELFYAIQATGWLNLYPNIQYVHQPGGFHQTDDVILGLKTTVRF